MNTEGSAVGGVEWAAASGDVWAERWRDTDRGLAGLSPHFLSAIVASAPSHSFSAFEVGCGAGSTSIAVADACPEAAIAACDISPALVSVVQQRTANRSRIRILLGDAEALAPSEGPFDLIFSRHGTMFFPDPVRAFRSFRSAASPDASLVFSCFQSWASNPWASELASAAAGRELPPPGREPGGFAFADPDYVLEILGGSGWLRGEHQAVPFSYVAGEGDNAVENALSFLTDIGPASRIVQSLPEEERGGALERMRGVIDRHFDGAAVVFQAAAWIWSAKAGAAA
jgi:SAM-dependent methyltransferase